MIIVEDVHKRYQTDHGPGKWILQGVSFTIPPRVNVGLVGNNGAGKSTLLRLIGGVDQPTRGKVERHCRVSWPMGFGGGLQGSLTGRQNAKFICRIHGHEEDIPERLAFIQEFAEIGDAFDEPVKTYSSGMNARLKFAISLAFDFDVYISDELTAVGDAAFKKKAKEAFQNLIGRAGLIMVSHQEGTLKEFCSAGIWLHEGRAHWFDNINDALAAYKNSQTSGQGNAQTGNKAATLNSQPPRPDQEQTNPILAKMNRLRKSLKVLERGLNGAPATVDDKEGERLIQAAKRVGMVLVPEAQIMERGYRLRKNAVPVLRKYFPAPIQQHVDLYDLQSQCVKVQVPSD